MQLDEIQKRLLREVADLHEVPEGAYNIRSNSQSAGRRSTANIEIVSKQEVSGLEVRIRPGTKRESVHIPVVMTESGLKEVVYNDFFVGEDADVVGAFRHLMQVGHLAQQPLLDLVQFQHSASSFPGVM